jgi:hypothetical protein
VLWKPIPRLWPGETVIIVASGPSLDPADLAVARSAGTRLVVVNRMWKEIPSADLLYAVDVTWWRSDEAPRAHEFAGLRVAGAKMVEGVFHVNVKHANELNPDWVNSGGNSGLQALSLAAHLGASRIALLGFTCGAGEGGKLHSHEDHGEGMTNPSPHQFAQWNAAFSGVAPHLRAAEIDVVNCSESKLTCFRRIRLSEYLDLP